MPTVGGTNTWKNVRLARVVFDLLLILIFLPPRKAERRFCAVGNPAWMPG
jgi:hypothetical protein